MTSPVPPAPEGVPVTLWRGDAYESHGFYPCESAFQLRDEWKALPVIPFNAMSAYAKTGEEVEGVLIEANLDDCETTPAETVRALLARLREAEDVRDDLKRAYDRNAIRADMAEALLKEARRYVEDNIAGRFVPSNGDAAALLSRIDAALKRDGEGT